MSLDKMNRGDLVLWCENPYLRISLIYNYSNTLFHV